jgi:hypothetical protein
MQLIHNEQLEIGVSFLQTGGNGVKPSTRDLHNEGIKILETFEKRAITEGDIVKGKNGRPYLKEGGSDFNMSHSLDAVAVSWSGKDLPGARMRTGCDIEKVREVKQMRAVAKRFFTENEAAWVLQDDIDAAGRFFRIWVLKESYIKAHGLSIADIGRVPDFVVDGDVPPSGACGKESKTSYWLYEIAPDSGCRYYLAAALTKV